jgi:hypothetical protein
MVVVHMQDGDEAMDSGDFIWGVMQVPDALP